MNKELEKAIKRLKGKIENDKKYINSPFGDLIEEIINDNKAIETVLNYIENSIPKEEYNKIKEENEKLKKSNRIYINSIQNIAPVLLESYIEKETIKEKIEENKKLIEECKKDEEHHGEIYLYEHDNKVLEELLEEK